jgi:hypothetical protein
MRVNRVLMNSEGEPFPEQPEILSRSRASGWQIVVAPRPIPGTVTWRGRWTHGDHYAAGPGESFAETWGGLDAWPVEFLTNDIIRDMLAAEAEELHLTLQELVDDAGGRIEDAASERGLPWATV